MKKCNRLQLITITPCLLVVRKDIDVNEHHWGKADDRNCNYGHPKMADMKLGKNLFCRLNCFYNVF
jgi:hypothetical protein